MAKVKYQCPSCGHENTFDNPVVPDGVIKCYMCKDVFAAYPDEAKKMKKTSRFGFGGKQQGGDHYGDPRSDVFAFCEANDIGIVAGTGIKYLARLGKKGKRDQWILDARKAIQCTERKALDLGITLEELYGDR